LSNKHFAHQLLVIYFVYSACFTLYIVYIVNYRDVRWGTRSDRWWPARFTRRIPAPSFFETRQRTHLRWLHHRSKQDSDCRSLCVWLRISTLQQPSSCHRYHPTQWRTASQSGESCRASAIFKQKGRCLEEWRRGDYGKSTQDNSSLQFASAILKAPVYNFFF